MSAAPTVEVLASAVRNGRQTAIGAVWTALAGIDETDGAINGFRETYRTRSIARAEEIDAAIDAGTDPGPLAGVPLAVKDNIVTAWGRTSCGSRMLADYRSPFSATVIERLEQAGAVIIGKTNCDEFGMGSSTEHCAFGPTRNPWDTRRVPGGSSGGSAAAVAARLCPAALGSDTGGSIRQPAALCGVVGMKPTYGLVSRWGLVAYGSSLDQVGPMTRTVRDAALVLGVIAGGDERDATCRPDPWTLDLDDVEVPIDDLRVGFVRQHRGAANHPAINDAVERAAAGYEALGAELVELDMPLTNAGTSTYYVIAPAEASSNLARFDGIRYGHRAETGPGDDLEQVLSRSRAEGFGREVQRRIMLGTFVLSAGYAEAYYRRALQVRRLIADEFEAAFERCDVILGPVTPAPAFRLGEKADPVSMYQCDVYTTAANIAGLPALALPFGSTAVDGRELPIGVQLHAPAFRDRLLLRAARMLERAAALPDRGPRLAGTTGDRLT
ncbi:MAG: Asp-tRNA(Asn)/Glu-tRNA(Gln) amidotransferase subunit GatA [Planctomycetota bacterium]